MLQRGTIGVDEIASPSLVDLYFAIGQSIVY